MRNLLLGLTALFPLMTSCALFETTVSRDVRAVWSPNGSSLLVVRSEYTTTKPDEPYDSSDAASNFRVILDEADGKAVDPLTTRTTIDEFDEELNQTKVARGGLAQYNPVYWYPDQHRAVFGGRLATVRNVALQTTWQAPVPVAELKAALGAVDEVYPTLTATEVASAMEIQDSVPSPDGRTLAVLYYNYYSLGDFTVTTFEYRVIGFYDLVTGNLLSAVRVSPEVWHLYRSITALPELPGEDQNWATMAWSPEGSGVWCYLYQGDTPPPPDVGANNEVQWVPLTDPTTVATWVPERPLPTSSGPVSPTGIGYWLETDGNATTLRTTTIADWVPHASIKLVDFATFLDGTLPGKDSSTLYNF